MRTDPTENRGFVAENKLLCLSSITLMALGILSLKKLPRNPTLYGRVKLSHVTSALSFAAGATILGIGLKKNFVKPIPKITGLKGEELAKALQELPRDCEILSLDSCEFEGEELKEIPEGVRRVIFNCKHKNSIKCLPDNVEEVEINDAFDVILSPYSISKHLYVSVPTSSYGSFAFMRFIKETNNNKVFYPKDKDFWESRKRNYWEEIRPVNIRLYGVNSDWIPLPASKRFISISFYGGNPPKKFLENSNTKILGFFCFSKFPGLGSIHKNVTSLILEPINPISKKDAKNIPEAIGKMFLRRKSLKSSNPSVVPEHVKELEIRAKRGESLSGNLVKVEEDQLETLCISGFVLTEEGIKQLPPSKELIIRNCTNLKALQNLGEKTSTLRLLQCELNEDLKFLPGTVSKVFLSNYFDFERVSLGCEYSFGNTDCFPSHIELKHEKNLFFNSIEIYPF